MDKTKFRPIGVENDKADNSVIAPVESGTTASRAYAAREHFIKNGAFCTAKTAIARGEAFMLNTNYEAGTIKDAIDNKVKKYENLTKKTDVNANVAIDIPNKKIRIIYFVWDNTHVFIPFYYHNHWYAKVTGTDAASTPLPNTEITFSFFYELG